MQMRKIQSTISWSLLAVSMICFAATLVAYGYAEPELFAKTLGAGLGLGILAIVTIPD